jgi:tetratricopeptide (TPR) repeat protein
MARTNPTAALAASLGVVSLTVGGWLVMDERHPSEAAVGGVLRGIVDPASEASAVPVSPAAGSGPASVTQTSPAPEAFASGDQALTWNEEGFELLAAGDLEGAIERFEAASELWPTIDTYANNLAEALFRSAKARWDEEPDPALALLERALAVLRDDARRKELQPLLDRWRRAREAEDGFWTESSPYFSVSFDGTRVELMNNVSEVLADLDTYYAEYGELFGQRPVENGRPKIRVVFYRRAAFAEVTGLGDWAGGVFDGTIRVPVESLGDERDRLRAVLRHELMHAFIHHVSGGNAPAWLNEGLAQWIERPGEGRALDVALARGRLRGHELFPLASLRGTLAAWSDKQAITRAYAQALLVIDHLVFSKGEALVFELVAASKAGGVAGPELHFLTRFPGFPLDEFLATVPR